MAKSGTSLRLTLGFALLIPGIAAAQPDQTATVTIQHPGGAFTATKVVNVFADGNPLDPFPGDGNFTYVYTIMNDALSFVPLTQFQVAITDISPCPVATFGTTPSGGVAPDNPGSLVGSDVTWVFTNTPINPGQTSDQLFVTSVCGPGVVQDTVASTTGAGIFDASAECLGPRVAPSAGCFLVIDEDSIDNGNPPNFFDDMVGFGASGADVNDDIPALSQRRELRFFDQNEGLMIKLHTGEVGDEGWFAPETIPQSWADAGPTSDGIRNFVGNPGLDGTGVHGPFAHGSTIPYNVGVELGTCDSTENNCETLLDKIPDVNPLRATGLKLLIGKTCCAVVWDSDISINYDPLDGSLKGEKLGVVAFTVDAVTKLEGFSSSTLPEVDLTIRDAETVCEGDLELFIDAPEPISSSEPFDIDPGN